MHPVPSSTLAASLRASSACAETLFASHHRRQTYTPQLANNSVGAYNLAVSSQITACGGLPWWLAYDATTRMLSCSGEAMYGSGSISSLSADSGGRLTVTGKAQVPTGGLSCPWARTYSYVIVIPVWRTQVGIEVGFV